MHAKCLIINLKAFSMGTVEILFYFFKFLKDFKSFMTECRSILFLAAMISNRIKATDIFHYKISSLFDFISFISNDIANNFSLDLVKCLSS